MNNNVCMDMYTNQYNFDRMFQYVCRVPQKAHLKKYSHYSKGAFFGNPCDWGKTLDRWLSMDVCLGAHCTCSCVCYICCVSRWCYPGTDLLQYLLATMWQCDTLSLAPSSGSLWWKLICRLSDTLTRGRITQSQPRALHNIEISQNIRLYDSWSPKLHSYNSSNHT